MTNNNSINFRSNIKFIHNTNFLKNHNKGIYIGFHHNEPNVIKSEKFFTEAIRTCTGGGLVIPEKEALGFHLWDDKTNKKNFDKIMTNMFRWIKNPQRALLIGSKNLKNSPYSIEQFQKIKNYLSQRIPNISIFEEHQYNNSQSHICYSLKDDTWLISTDFIESGNHFTVNSLNTLKKSFKSIKIANGDTLFIANKIITENDAPEFFR